MNWLQSLLNFEPILRNEEGIKSGYIGVQVGEKCINFHSVAEYMHVGTSARGSEGKKWKNLSTQMEEKGRLTQLKGMEEKGKRNQLKGMERVVLSMSPKC